MFATLHRNQTVRCGEIVGGTRVIPLFVSEGKVAKAEAVCRDNPIIKVAEFKPFKVGLVTTGSEIYHGRIQDAFGPVLKEKFSALGSTVVKQVFADDNDEMIADSIRKLIDEGMDMVAVTGGMSVDPDDRTPSGIRKAGGEVVTYGAPVLPGAMFLLAYIGDVPVVGLPGCVMYHINTIFDLVAPRLLAGEILTRKDIIKLGHGGLCLVCEECRYPECGFGKGS
jgi:molybdenum cofactor synthesis domain-containing protein